MICIVAGGAGFIGSHLATRLLEVGHSVVIIDNLRTGKMENVPKDATFILGDIGDESLYNSLPTQVDCFFNLAAQSSGEISFSEPEYDLKTNTLGTVLSAKWCVDTGVKRYVFASSMSVYGNGGTSAVTELVPLSPISFYGIGKLASERYLSVYNDLGLSTVSLRLFNVYGPGQNLDNMKQGMVSIYLAYLARGARIDVKGRLDRFRDFVYVDDVVNAFERCLQTDISGEYNIATGVQTTVGSLLEQLCEAWGGSVEIQELEGTPRDQFGVFGDSAAFRHATGWHPAVCLKDGISAMVTWAKSLTLS
ncbi:MAG: NAD-dependent epimerase/dehydratase family protein [bacterium]|nr:NAD-dependent epimerase/dehydratase family protein [bacterium]